MEINWFLAWILTTISLTIAHFIFLYLERRGRAEERRLYEKIIKEKEKQIKILNQMKSSLEKHGNINDMKWVSRDTGETIKEAKEN